MSKRRHDEQEPLLDEAATGDQDAMWRPFASAGYRDKRLKTNGSSVAIADACVALESAVAAALDNASQSSDAVIEILNRALVELLTQQLKANARGDLSAAMRAYLKLIQLINATFAASRDAAASAPPPLAFTLRPPQSSPPPFSFGRPQPASPTTGFSFGAAAASSPARPPPAFSFGSPSSSAAPAFGSAASSASSFGFGASSSSPVTFGAPRVSPGSPATGFTFGSSTTPSSPPTSFGQPPASPSSFFGAAASSRPPSFEFGASASPPFGAAAKPSSQFGSPAVSPVAALQPKFPVKEDVVKSPTKAKVEQFAGFMAAPNTSFGVWNEPALLNQRVRDSDIKLISKISTGGFGDVWLSEFQGKQVAVKRLASGEQTKEASVVFAAEIKLMMELRHPKIAAFVGVEWAKEWEAQALSEYEPLGDLRSLMDSSKAADPLDWADFKCQAAIDVADALAYLNARSPPVVMEVLRARNVLVCDMEGHCKLSVFAAARCRSVSENLTSSMATTPWLASEIIMDRASKSERSVVYSFGALLCELDSGKEPLSDAKNPDGSAMSSFKVAQQVAQGKLAPVVSDECPGAIAELATECMAFDPVKRPTAASIAYRLREILKGDL